MLETVRIVPGFQDIAVMRYIPPAEAEVNYYRQLAKQAATVA
ncbi:hypothetical protein NTGZN8_330010 [Candidatus Nitrotoga fabula]|uniref:Uncharacterized protein n=1 Tax=Candidatus Nitrotoga fabula TaxID=2182327 RepID=A0A916BEP6_9PROT|nr:hypothetical protein NTGZN8_330010 [Candidatus Nitrotoga fabula]